MYVLCRAPLSIKRTPRIYEMDRPNICPVCGEFIKIGRFDLAMKKIVYPVVDHVVSDNPDSLRFEKSLFYKRKYRILI